MSSKPGFATDCAGCWRRQFLLFALFEQRILARQERKAALTELLNKTINLIAGCAY
jgi:hypothetical protein